MAEQWVRDQADNGRLPAYKVGRQWRFDPIELADWLTIRQNRTVEPRRPRRYANLEREAPNLDAPIGLDLGTTVTAGEIAEDLALPKNAIVGWISGGLVPGYHAGNQWLIDRTTYREVREILERGGWKQGWPAGKGRTESAREHLEQEMLSRRGIGQTVRSLRYHQGRVPIYWVPGPGSQVRQRRASGPGDDDA